MKDPAVTPAATWLGLEDTVLGGRSPTPEGQTPNTTRVIPPTGGPQGSQIHRNRNWTVGPRAWGKGGARAFGGDRGSPWGAEKVLEVEGGDGGSAMCLR